VVNAQVADAAELERRIAAAAAAGGEWGQRRATTRAQVLSSVGEEL
jgi:acyl-CoA reductase-like NAD-dependent aldehyde dehydrogenase